ncbi:glycosyltransferase family 2 protein [Desulfoplanes formicivorans]|nr:hypothetical protein [Desulfoplanes formicivorans]
MVVDNNAPQPYAKADLRIKCNLFWAGGLDYCVQHVVHKGYTHLWFLNDDILFVSPAPFIHRVWNRMLHVEKHCGPVGVYSPSFTTNPYHPHMVQSVGQGFTRIGYVDGIAPLISLDCLQEIGGLDMGDNHVGYGVDVWLSTRSAEKGWVVIVDHELVARHRYHGTARTISGMMERARSS